jgi:hypothetical protein
MEKDKYKNKPTGTKVFMQTKHQVRMFNSFEEANEADAEARANLSPEEHLINTIKRIKEMYADELKAPMDKTLNFKKDD